MRKFSIKMETDLKNIDGRRQVYLSSTIIPQTHNLCGRLSFTNSL